MWGSVTGREEGREIESEGRKEKERKKKKKVFLSTQIFYVLIKYIDYFTETITKKLFRDFSRFLSS